MISVIQTSQSLACRSLDIHSGTCWSEETRVNADFNVNLLSAGQWNWDIYGDDTETGTGLGRFNIDLHTSLPITYT